MIAKFEMVKSKNIFEISLVKIMTQTFKPQAFRAQFGEENRNKNHSKTLSGENASKRGLIKKESIANA